MAYKKIETLKRYQKDLKAFADGISQSLGINKWDTRQKDTIRKLIGTSRNSQTLKDNNLWYHEQRAGKILGDLTVNSKEKGEASLMRLAKKRAKEQGIDIDIKNKTWDEFYKEWMDKAGDEFLEGDTTTQERYIMKEYSVGNFLEADELQIAEDIIDWNKE